MSTAGDQNQRSPLYVIGGEGKAIWTKELEVALKAGAVDAIVHCLKDVPTTLPEGLSIAAILEREDPRDALVIKDGLPYKTLDELPAGSVIGTSSVRRVAQLRSRYPKLVFSDVRGNLITRLSKLDSPTGPYTALILAAAGLLRLSLGHRITSYLSAPVLYHSVGQGSLAIEVRAPPAGASPADNRDKRIEQLIKSIACWRSTWKCEAERALLRTLEGGCSIPVGVDTWLGSQKCEERLAKSTKITIRSPEGGEETIEVEGHTLNVDHSDTLQEDLGNVVITEGESRPPLERLATGAQEASAAAAAAAAADAPHVPTLPTAETMSIEDFATPPAEGETVHLSANVVSLDGTRRSTAYLSAHCHTVQDAVALGEAVANILVHDQGARVILDEVERHRALAEQADERRRAERKERLKQMDKSASEGESQSQSGAVGEPDGAAAHTNEHVNGHTHTNGHANGNVEEEQHKLMQVIGLSNLDAPAPVTNGKLNGHAHGHTNGNAHGNGNGGLGFGENQSGSGHFEVDRRGVPRDDGQAKAWEV